MGARGSKLRQCGPKRHGEHGPRCAKRVNRPPRRAYEPTSRRWVSSSSLPASSATEDVCTGNEIWTPSKHVTVHPVCSAGSRHPKCTTDGGPCASAPRRAARGAAVAQGLRRGLLRTALPHKNAPARRSSRRARAHALCGRRYLRLCVATTSTPVPATLETTTSPMATGSVTSVELIWSSTSSTRSLGTGAVVFTLTAW